MNLLFIFILILIIIVFIIFFRILETYKINKKIYLTATKIHIIDYNEIFPLKKYKYYDKYLYGPNKYDLLLKEYSKKGDAMKYASRQYGSKANELFKLTDKDYKPADLNITIFKGTICSKNTKRCSFSIGPNYYTPPCCASYLTEMLFYLHDLFEKKNITYFIYWGTLLGSIRHGGLIPWDTDVDIHIHENDIIKIKGLQPLIEKETHYKLSLGSIIRLNYSKTNTQHVDIFTYK
jgi:hypothetical protein